PTAGIGDRLIPGLLASVGLHQLLEHLAVELAQALAHKELPLIKRWAIWQRESGQKIRRVQLDGSVQLGKTLGREHILRGGGQAGCHMLSERGAVEPYLGALIQADGLGAGLQHSLAYRLIQAMPRAPQPRPALAPIALGP